MERLIVVRLLLCIDGQRSLGLGLGLGGAVFRAQ